MSGGIGDYLHYLVRVPAFCARTGVRPDQLVVFVESTNPAQVESLFARALPELAIEFVPRRIHWTKTNPLLHVERARDRAQRPAACYVRARGFTQFIDWFLPFCCAEFAADIRTIGFLAAAPGRGRIVVSSRDKGCLWWPTAAALRCVQARCATRELVTLGTEDEREPWFPGFRMVSNVLEALTVACAAELYVGTDTGIATARELLGAPNIYCVDQHWLDELMRPYGYWNDGLAARSRSMFAHSLAELDDCLARRLAAPRSS